MNFMTAMCERLRPINAIANGTRGVMNRVACAKARLVCHQFLRGGETVSRKPHKLQFPVQFRTYATNLSGRSTLLRRVGRAVRGTAPREGAPSGTPGAGRAEKMQGRSPGWSSAQFTLNASVNGSRRMPLVPLRDTFSGVTRDIPGAGVQFTFPSPNTTTRPGASPDQWWPMGRALQPVCCCGRGGEFILDI